MASAPVNLKVADHLSGRDNNLNLIRFVAALAVLVSHGFPIALGPGTTEPLEHAAGMSLGEIAVAVFFALSGLLIANSFERRSSWVQFVIARILRLFPALLLVLVITVVAGFAFTNLAPAAYLGSTETWTYVPRNLSLAFLQYPLPGVFERNVYPSAINGSLWTLFYEVVCYAGLFFVGIIGVLQRKWLISGISLAICVAYIFSLDWQPLPGNITTRLSLLIKLAFPFTLGVMAFVWRDRFAFGWKLALALWLVTAFALGSSYAPFFVVIALAYTIGWLGFVPKGRALLFNKLGDYSYGIYIYAFPVQQAMSNLFPSAGPFGNIALSVPPTLLLAIMSWHLLEKRSLARIKPIAALLQSRVTWLPQGKQSAQP